MPYPTCTISGNRREQRCSRKDTKNGLPERTEKNAGAVFNREDKRAESEYNRREREERKGWMEISTALLFSASFLRTANGCKARLS